MPRNIAANYVKVQANTASPGQRVIMLYKAMQKHLEDASAECDNLQDPERFLRINEHIQRADQMIRHLKIALDIDHGGEIAENLDSLYAFWRRHLLKANMEKSKQKIEEVLKMVRDMTNAWVVAEQNVRTDHQENK